MRDLDRALADIAAIRLQVAAGSAFQGYGPAAVAATGALALATAAAQAAWLDDPTGRPLVFLAGWIAAALLAAGLVGGEMVARSRRDQSGLADDLVLAAAERFVPAGAAGALLALVLCRAAPDSLWMLPGLWQILVSLGLFASLRGLPRSCVLGAAWYLVSGLAVLTFAAEERTLSPWTMGLPFAIGQILLAALLHVASEPGHDDA